MGSSDAAQTPLESHATELPPLEPSSVELSALEPQALEPQALEPQPATHEQSRDVIRPKLIKRESGVRLTEIHRESGQGTGPRAPRGTGALVETEAVSELRRARAIKRATELINTVSEELELSEKLSQHNRALMDKARRAAQALAQAERRSSSSDVSPDQSPMRSADESFDGPIDGATDAPELPSVELSADSPEVDWELDPDTLKALKSLEELNLNQLPDLSQDLSPSSTSSSVRPDIHRQDHAHSGELSPQQFFNAIDRQAITTRPSAIPVTSATSAPPAVERSSGLNAQQSYTRRRGETRVETQRGQVVWTRSAPRDESAEHTMNLNLGGQATFQGWRLERLQNKIEGAETWIGSRVGPSSQVDARGSRGAQGVGVSSRENSQVVIKVVWPHLLSDNPMMWQFDAEVQVRALQQLSHPTVPTMLAWGEDERLGAWVTVTEWVEGVSLAAHLKRGALSVDDALKIFLPLAEGLAECHREGLIHRKVQPTHIIITPSGPRLISFQWVGGGTGEDIQRGQQGAYQIFKQRPKFLAPEWMRDALITSAVDVYALGACLLDAIAPQGESWRDAPPQLHIALAGALYPAVNERSEITDFIDDLKRSQTRYLYQAGNEVSPELPAEQLPLHEVIARIRVNELGWHLLATLSSRDGARARALEPWGNFEEVVTALERAARYQDVAPALRSDDDLPPQYLEGLERRAGELDAREAQLKRLEEELEWRDRALRAQESELNERDAALQEEATRIAQLRESVRLREEEVRERRDALKEKQDVLKLRDLELQQRHDELEGRSAALRVSEEELTRQAAAHEYELELLKATLESEHARAQAAVRAEEAALTSQLDARARMLIEERERAVEEAQRVAAEERARADAERARAAQELDRERARHREELAEREAKRIARSDEESAFVRGGLQRAHQDRDVLEPDELTYREFEVSGITLRARYCPPGIAWLGDEGEDAKPEERPRHRVKLTRGFWLTEVPITQAQWSALMERNPSSTLGLNHPVEGVGWAEAVLFCNTLSEAFGFETAYEVEGELERARHRAHITWRDDASGFRLPTEAEWEYAARSGLSGQRHRYALGESLDEVGWYTQNSGGSTHPVGLKAPNQWGLYDMNGSVWEWCHDEWRRDAYRERLERSLTDPVAYNDKLTPRVVRGGAWYDFASACRLSARPGQDVHQGYGIGFRVCLPTHSSGLLDRESRAL